MKTFSAALCSLAVMIPAATANFDLYFSASGGFIGGTSSGYVVFDSAPDCEEAGDVSVFESRDDVSGDKYGIRCKGDGCAYDHDNIDEVEMNFNKDYHWTIYKESNYDLIGVDGKVYGSCFPYPGDEPECKIGGGVAGRHKSYRKIRCLINDVSSADLYA